MMETDLDGTLNWIFEVAEHKGYSVTKDRKFRIFYNMPKPKQKIEVRPEFIFTKGEDVTHVFISASPNYKHWAAELVIADLIFAQDDTIPYFFLMYKPSKDYVWNFNNISVNFLKGLKLRLDNIGDKLFPLDLTTLDFQNLEEILKL